MRYAQINKCDIANGEGVGVSLFIQGCDFHCKNCFNPSTWDWDGGCEWNQEKEKELLELCNKSYITRLSILGGEPLNPKNIDAIIGFAKHFKEVFPNKKIWIWSGYNFESYISKTDIVKYADYIIDGLYDDDKKDLTLKFRGSSNQRMWRQDNSIWKEIISESEETKI